MRHHRHPREGRFGKRRGWPPWHPHHHHHHYPPGHPPDPHGFGGPGFPLRGGWGSFAWYLRARLQRRLFMWFGAAIIITGAVVGAVGTVTSPMSWHREFERARVFVGNRFEAVWDEPDERDRLAQAVAKDFEVDVSLLDAGHKPMFLVGRRCGPHGISSTVTRDNRTLGYVVVCAERTEGRPKSFIIAVVCAIVVLWAAAGLLARRLARPLSQLAVVAGELGRGNLTSRVSVDRSGGEVALLGGVLNDMAERIQKQLADQRALLATVSHEIRTPLQRIRLLTELVRAKHGEDQSLDEIDREVVQIDALVAELLASSRVDFAALTPVEIDAIDLARRAVEKANLEDGILDVRGEPGAFTGDPTLCVRAVTNLLENAKRHAGKPSALVVERKGDLVEFAVEDDGPGLSPGDEARVFEPFFRKSNDPSSVGLGLSLVKRIAEAHHGHAYAENRPNGGARVAVSFAVGAS